MRREDMMKLYTRDVEINPKTGKQKVVLRYTGPYYQMEPNARKALTRMGWLFWMLTLLALAVAGLIPTRAGNALYVQVWYLFTLLPFFYLLLGLLRMRRMKEQFTAVDLSEGVHYVKGAAWGLAGLGGLWAATEIIFLVMNGLNERWLNDIIFLVCGAGIAVMGVALSRAISQTKIDMLEQE